jgi:hypothetical protein
VPFSSLRKHCLKHCITPGDTPILPSLIRRQKL